MQMQLTELLYHASPRYRMLYNSHFVQVKEYYICSIIAVPSHLRCSASGFVVFCALASASAQSRTKVHAGAKWRRSKRMWQVSQSGKEGKGLFLSYFMKENTVGFTFLFIIYFLRKFLKATNPRHVYCRNYLYTYIMLFFSLFFPRNFPTPPPPPSLPPLPLPLNRKIQRER